jgi:GMP synthase (glutamine-hydrolysing)
MKTAIAIRHVHFEDLGAFAPVLEAADYAVTMLDAGVGSLRAAVPRPAEPDLIVVLGGPVGAYEEDRYPFLREELHLLEARLAAGRPTLGVCLGAQLMARALGAGVSPMGPGLREIGWAPIAITPEGERGPLRRLADGASVLHWHGDTFKLPPGATLLASTARCRNQAFSLGRYALGLQFHPEASSEGFERWLVGHATEIAAAGVDPRRLRADAARHGSAAAERGRRLLEDWLSGLSDEAMPW